MGKIIDNILDLFDKKGKINLAKLFVMALVGGLIETVGISAILPFVSIMMDDSVIQSNKVYSTIYETLNCKDSGEFLILIASALIIVFIIKNIYLYFLYDFQYSFILDAQKRVSLELLNNFLKKPYSYYLDINSSYVNRLMITDVNNSFLLITSVMKLLVEVITVLLISIFLLFINWKVTASLILMLEVVLLVIKRLLKPVLEKSRDDRTKYIEARVKWINQSVQGIKEIKISRNENFFSKRYDEVASISVEADRKFQVSSQMPRLMIESLFICGVMLYVIGLIINDIQFASIVPTLSVFAFAAIRLMPSTNRISVLINDITYYANSLEAVVEERAQIEAEHKSYDGKGNDLTWNNCIELKNISFSYNKTQDNLFENVNIRIPLGKTIGIVGESGAGKTTLVDIILGLLEPKEGEITIDGHVIKDSYNIWLDSVGYIPQQIFLMDDNIRNNVAFGYDVEDDEIWEALEEARLGEYMKEAPDGLDTELGERGIRLSGGQRQRIGIARALLRKPKVLVFDEATASLDNQTEREVMESIGYLHGKVTIIIIAHRLSTIMDSDMLIRVEHGNVKKITKQDLY